METVTNNYEETQKVGEEFAHKLKGGDIIFLYGDLGAGKTTFMQGLAKGLGIAHRIISPTFIIMRTYVIPAKAGIQKSFEPAQDKNEWIPDQVRDDNMKLYHIDLYRTETRRDLEGLGLFDVLNDPSAVVAIEWPEKFGELPEKRYDIIFKSLDENRRSITITKHE